MARSLTPFPKLRSVWRLLRVCAWIVLRLGRLLAVSLEILFHRDFGERYALSMLCSIGLCYAYSSLAGLMCAVNGTNLLRLFIWILFAFSLFHYLDLWLSRRNSEEIHSYSNGVPWPIWERLCLTNQTVERYCEPALAFAMGRFISRYDAALALWLTTASVALFIKAQMARQRTRTRLLDAVDSRLEGKQLQGAVAERLPARQSASTEHTVEQPENAVPASPQASSNHFDELDPELKKLIQPEEH